MPWTSARWRRVDDDAQPEPEEATMRAKDIMTRPVYTVRPTDTVEHVAALLTEKKITAVPVLNEADEVIGMVSEGDLLRHRVPADPTAHPWRAAGGNGEKRPKTVAEVMSTPPVTSWPQADVADIAEAMLQHNVRSVPILDDEELVGIVSRRDILRTVIRTDDVLAQEVQDRLDAYAGGVHRWTATVTGGTATIDGAFDDDAERTVVAIMARTVPGVAAVHVER
jgi:CBS domain-containing protein